MLRRQRMQNKTKHSKIRNSGLLFEFLLRQITLDVLNKHNSSKAVQMIKENFNDNTELGKELGLYNVLLNTKFNDDKKAEFFINEVLQQRQKINNSKLRRERYNLVRVIKENYDMTFIDTWHVYGQLKRELEKFSKVTNKYIIMHDTTVDGINGETVRMKWNAEKQSKETGIPVEEIKKGLMPAIEEFLVNNKNWIMKERFTNNNGLTILEKKN